MRILSASRLFLAVFLLGIGPLCAKTNTSVALATSGSPSVFGSSVTLTATVSPATATGTVTFFDGVAIVGSKPVSAGTAALPTIALASGARKLTAFYSGDANFNSSRSPVVTQVVKANAATALVQAPSYSFRGGSYYSFIAAADLNGDGRPDVVTTDGIYTLFVSLNNGNGTFSNSVSYSLPINYYPGNSVWVGVADFNGDGKPDLIAIPAIGGGSLFLGNGDGTFGSPSTFSYDGNPTYGVVAAIADFNGDGKPDIVVANQFPGISVLLGNGAGGFAAPIDLLVPATPQLFDIGDQINISVAVDDFNGDGKPDIAVSNEASGSVSVLLGNGDGTFATPVNYPGVQSARSVVTADFNGDGIADLALGIFGGVDILLGKGDGTFGAPRVVGAGNSLSFLLTGDFNGDGITDLASVDASVLLLGNGDGTFAPGIAFGSNQLFAAVADFNGDGRTDLVELGGSVLLGTVGATTPSVALSSSQNPSTVGAFTTLTATLTPSTPTGDVIFRDGSNVLGSAAILKGLAQLTVPFNIAGTHSLTANYSGDATFAAASQILSQSVNSGTATSVTLMASANPITFGSASTITAKLSNAAATGTITIYDGANVLGTLPVSSGSVAISAALLTAGVHPLRAYYSGDKNFDPSAAAVVSLTVNTTAANAFYGPMNSALSGTVIASAVGDFNGDGKSDLAILAQTNLQILLGAGNGTFGVGFNYAYSLNDIPTAIILGDFNGDGKTDLVTLNQYQSIDLFLGHGDGSFAAPVIYNAPSQYSGAYSLVAADFNSDGKTDLFSNIPFFDNILPGLGNGTFAAPVNIALSENLSSISTPTFVAAADVNGDGKADLITIDTDLSVAVSLGNGDFTFNNSIVALPAPANYINGPTSLVTGDFNGDGKIDIAVSFVRAGNVEVLLGNGDGTFTPGVTLSLDAYTLAVGDFNGDGKLDLAAGQVATAASQIVLGNGDGTFGPITVFSSLTGGIGATIENVGDFNGDGRSDLAMVVHATAGYGSTSSLSVFLGASSATSPGAFITSETLGSIRNNFTGNLGMQFTVGSMPITLTGLGRYVAPGNHQVHQLTLLGPGLPSGQYQVNLDLTTSTPGQFKYAATTPLYLQAGATYTLVSSETSGGDQWYDYGLVTSSSYATVAGPIYYTNGLSQPGTVVPAPGYSYVPVSFQFEPGDVYSASAPTVDISAPANGTQVAGIIPITATVSASAGHTIASIQFQVGTQLLPAVTTPPYTSTFDTTTIANGSLNITATAVDSAGNSATSGTIQVTVTNPTPPSRAFIKSQASGTLRNNLTGYVGMKFTVGSNAMLVSQLGRWFVPGNYGSHMVKLVDAGTGLDVPGGSVVVSLSSPATPGLFAYVALTNPITLQAGYSYYLVSQELPNLAEPDQWHDLAPYTTDGSAVINGPVYTDASGNYVPVAAPGQAYGPVNLVYVPVGSITTPPPTVSVTGPLAGQTVSGVATLSANATAASGLTIASVQFLVNGMNAGVPATTAPYAATFDTTNLANGTATVTAIATDSFGNSTTSASVQFVVNNSVAAVPFVTSFQPGPLRNNFYGGVGMRIQVGPEPITITQLGAYLVAGGTTTHSVYINPVNGGAQIALVTISSTGPSGFYYAVPSTPAVLQANTQYDILCTESTDYWYDYGPVTTAGTGATVLGSVYYSTLVNIPGTSYVPVNFYYKVGAPVVGPTVSISSPAAGAVSGTISVTASATSPVGIASVQFKLNGNFVGPVLTSSPYTTTIDTTKFANGAASLTAFATDTAGHTATSAAVQITISNAGAAPTPLVVGVPPSPLRNNYSGFVGTQFTVGSAPLLVGQLGRYVLSGNSQSHLVKLVNANGTDVTGASVSIPLSGVTAGQYTYGTLASTVTLLANTTYYLVSQEFSGGDYWYDFGSVSTTSDVTLNGPTYTDAAGRYVLVAGPGTYVPVNLTYTLASKSNAPAISITSPTPGSVTGVVTLTATATAASGLTVASVQFQLNGSNTGPLLTTAPYSTPLDTTKLANGPYTITAIVKDSASNTATSSGIAITVNNTQTATPFLNVPVAGTLRNNYSGFVGMQFTVGNTAIVVSELGRYVFTGNSLTHTVKLANADGSDVAGGSLSLPLSGAMAGSYTYGLLAAPVTLQANTTYYLLSQESNGGDTWYDLEPVMATSSAKVNGPVYTDTAARYILVNSVGASYVPANFIYSPQ